MDRNGATTKGKSSQQDQDHLAKLLEQYLEHEMNGDTFDDKTLQDILSYNPIRCCFLILIAAALTSCVVYGSYAIGKSYYNFNPVTECIVDNHLRDFAPLKELLLNKGADCKLCRNVRKIVKRRSLSPEEFEKKYAYTRRPVVVTDATRNWTAMSHFSFDFLKGVFQGKSLEAVAEKCQFFPYQSNFDSLGDVFNMPRERVVREPGTEPWYVGWSNCHLHAAEELRKHYGRPYFLPPLSEASKVDWIFMGNPGHGAPLHIDDVKMPSWQAQLRGRKRWTLEPPFECRLDCPTNLTVVVNPGDVIVLDTNYWYHSTEILGKDMSLTIGTEYD